MSTTTVDKTIVQIECGFVTVPNLVSLLTRLSDETAKLAPAIRRPSEHYQWVLNKTRERLEELKSRVAQVWLDSNKTDHSRTAFRRERFLAKQLCGQCNFDVVALEFLAGKEYAALEETLAKIDRTLAVLLNARSATTASSDE